MHCKVDIGICTLHCHCHCWCTCDAARPDEWVWAVIPHDVLGTTTAFPYRTDANALKPLLRETKRRNMFVLTHKMEREQIGRLKREKCARIEMCWTQHNTGCTQERTAKRTLLPVKWSPLAKKAWEKKRRGEILFDRNDVKCGSPVVSETDCHPFPLCKRVFFGNNMTRTRCH